MFQAIDVEIHAAHRGRQRFSGGCHRLRRLGLGRRLYLGGRRRRYGYGWAARPGLNGWRWLRAAACDGDARSSDDADDNRARTGADQEVASRCQRTKLLAASRLDFGRLATGRTSTFWHRDLPSRKCA